jgi:hypothetical protein
VKPEVLPVGALLLSKHFKLGEEDPRVYERESIIDHFNPLPFLAEDMPARRAVSPAPERPAEGLSKEGIESCKSSIRAQLSFLNSLGVDLSEFGQAGRAAVTERDAGEPISSTGTVQGSMEEVVEEEEEEEVGEPRGSKECPVCHLKFSSTSRCLSHYRLKHDKKTKHQCHKCKKYLGSKRTLAQHLEMHTNTDMSCGECSRNFRSWTGLGKHMSKDHPKEDSDTCYFCKWCCSKFKSNNLRMQHQNACRCSPVKAPKHACRSKGCSSEFTRVKDRNEHEWKYCRFSTLEKGKELREKRVKSTDGQKRKR